MGSEVKATSVSSLKLGKFESIKKMISGKQRYTDTQSKKNESIIAISDKDKEEIGVI